MTGLNERQKAHENQFALQEENEFKAKIMAVKLLSTWAINELKISGSQAEIYNKNLLDIGLKNKDHDKVVDYVYDSFIKFGLSVTKSKLEAIFLDDIHNAKVKLSS